MADIVVVGFKDRYKADDNDDKFTVPNFLKEIIKNMHQHKINVSWIESQQPDISYTTNVKGGT